MTDKTRTYPNIAFVETDTEALTNALIQSYERFTGRTLYPADPVRLFLLWMADIIIQERVNIDFSAKQNLPRYAEGDYLDSLAELFKDAYRLEPEKAKTTLRFTLSIALELTTIIPAGTRATVDGELVFQTLSPLTIPEGNASGEVAAVCLTAGEIGNGFIPGQISKLIDIFPYFGSVENITKSAGGADRESDAAFYQRMRESLETFSTAGSLGSYEYYAKSASALIADVKVTSPTAGLVDVRVLLQGGELPGEEILKTVSDVLSADTVRPLTDYVLVSAPETVLYSIDLTYYTQEIGPLSTETVIENVTAAVEEFKEWQAGKLGRDIDPSELVYRIKKAGVKRVEVRSPAFTIVSGTAVAQIEEARVVNGGPERE